MFSACLRPTPFDFWRKGGFVLLMALGSGAAQAQQPTSLTPQNVLQLSVSAQQEAVQDWLTLVLSVRHQAVDAATVQNQLKHVLEQALAQLKGKAGPGVDVSSGAFTVHPRQGRDGQIVGWQGSAELVLQGRDVSRVSALASSAPGMSVAQLHFSLSREATQRLEDEVRKQAIARFRDTALQVAKDFGFAGYTLREISLGEAGLPPLGRAPRLHMAAAEAALSSAPVPVEPGKSLVQVTVSGSVQMQ